jgi:KaiC/GvpD/RAD55 family RecA-like ATPase
VEGTFSWLKDNSDYKDWFRAQKTPFLCVSGPQGTGKTYLTYRCYQLLQEMTKPKTLTTETSKTRQNISVAYFFFDPGSETHSLKNALENLIVQIASQDSKYCDSLSKDIDKKGLKQAKVIPPRRCGRPSSRRSLKKHQRHREWRTYSLMALTC